MRVMIKPILVISMTIAILSFSAYTPTTIYAIHVEAWDDAQNIWEIQDDRNRYSLEYPLISGFVHTVHNKFDKLSYDAQIDGRLYPIMVTFHYNLTVPTNVKNSEEFMKVWEEKILPEGYSIFERNLTKYTLSNQTAPNNIITGYSDSGRQVVSLNIFLTDEKQNKNTFVTYVSYADTFEHYLPLAEQIIKSVKILK